MSTTLCSESMNAFFDGYVGPKTTLKQFADIFINYYIYSTLYLLPNAYFVEIENFLLKVL